MSHHTTEQLNAGVRVRTQSPANDFYCTSLDHRISVIKRLHNTKPVIDIHQLMNDIADGAGGCERMMYTTPEGNDGWVSVLGEADHRTWYVFVEVQGSNHAGYESVDAGRVVVACTGTHPHDGPDSTDSLASYVKFYEAVMDGYETVTELDEEYGYNPFNSNGVQTVCVHSSMGDRWEVGESVLELQRWTHDVVSNLLHYTTDIQVAHYGFDPRVLGDGGEFIGTDGLPDATGTWNAQTERIDWEQC